jgi:hypothetical protein
MLGACSGQGWMLGACSGQEWMLGACSGQGWSLVIILLGKFVQHLLTAAIQCSCLPIGVGIL